mmetsp:Transcript_7573/g.15752  ORF Transcript_7573/g.15752 Transcript_7573/m.15752 type:complete len:275 (-) Transcript_7573:507-1331(-)
MARAEAKLRGGASRCWLSAKPRGCRPAQAASTRRSPVWGRCHSCPGHPCHRSCHPRDQVPRKIPDRASPGHRSSPACCLPEGSARCLWPPSEAPGALATAEPANPDPESALAARSAYAAVAAPSAVASDPTVSVRAQLVQAAAPAATTGQGCRTRHGAWTATVRDFAVTADCPLSAAAAPATDSAVPAAIAAAGTLAAAASSAVASHPLSADAPAAASPAVAAARAFASAPPVAPADAASPASAGQTWARATSADTSPAAAPAAHSCRGRRPHH